MPQHNKEPESCGECPKAWIPHGDPDTRICGLIGDSSIIEADKFNPECPLIDKPKKSPTKADMAREIAQLRQDKAELVEALKETTNHLAVSQQIIKTIKGDRYSAQQDSNVRAWDRGQAAIAKHGKES